jgi:L-asparaginase/Glu-tRNA(Gln) amidotransferase subunit D
MRFSINMAILAILILQLALSAAMQEAALIPIRTAGGEIRNVLVVATGGTIAGWAALAAQVVGYEPGHFLIEDVLRSIANLSIVANVSSIQVTKPFCFQDTS